MRITTSMTQSDEFPNESNSMPRKLPRGKTCAAFFDPNTFDIHFDSETYDVVSSNSETNHKVIRMLDIENALVEFLSTRFVYDTTIEWCTLLMDGFSTIICILIGMVDLNISVVITIWFLILASIWNALGYLVISYKNPRDDKIARSKRMDCFHYYQKMKEAESSLVFVENLKKLINGCHEINGKSLIHRACVCCDRRFAVLAKPNANEIFIATNMKAMEMVTKLLVELTSRPVLITLFTQVIPVYMNFANIVYVCSGFIFLHLIPWSPYQNEMYPFLLLLLMSKMFLQVSVKLMMYYAEEKVKVQNRTNNPIPKNILNYAYSLDFFSKLFHAVDQEGVKRLFVDLEHTIDRERDMHRCEITKIRGKLRKIKELYGF